MKNIMQQGSFEKRHFDSTLVRVNRNGIDVMAVLGTPLDDLTIAELSGAPTGSEIELYELSPEMAFNEEDDVPPGLYFRVKNPQYILSENRVGIYAPEEAPDDRLGLYIDLVDFMDRRAPGSKAEKGLAARMIGNIVRAALRTDIFSVLRLLAAGGRLSDDRPDVPGERWGGYFVWPNYGFNMPLLDETLDIFSAFPHYPKGLFDCNTVRDVLELDGGREFWRYTGDGFYMEFELAIGSSSVRVLDQHLGSAQFA